MSVPPPASVGRSASLLVTRSSFWPSTANTEKGAPARILLQGRLVDVCGVSVEATPLQRLLGRAVLVVNHRTLAGSMHRLVLRCPASVVHARVQFLRGAKKWATLQAWATATS